MLLFGIVFFFKQKTAYEMRISDWSSDVCSSDLDALAQLLAGLEMRDVLARQRNRVAGLGIAAGTGRPVMLGNTADTADLDAIAVGQRPAHHFQQRLHGHVDILEIGRASCRERLCTHV